jgi:hypothetical protein
MITDDLDKRVRNKQAALITKLGTSVSFSSVINDILRGDYKLPR